MTQVATEQQWKHKYRELVDELEDKERAWAKLEAALRAAAGKLAMAALGQSPSSTRPSITSWPCSARTPPR